MKLTSKSHVYLVIIGFAIAYILLDIFKAVLELSEPLSDGQFFVVSVIIGLVIVIFFIYFISELHDIFIKEHPDEQ